MADEPTNFFDDNDITDDEEVFEEQTQEEEKAPSTFKVGEKEYSQDDLEKLVGLGEMAREAEEKYNTPMDRVYPEYTKSRQELKELRSQLDQKVEVGDITQEQASEALKAAEQIGLVTKESVKSIMADAFQEFYHQQKAVDNLIENTQSLEKEIDGSDGRPPFKQKDMLEWMNEEGITDPKKAYKLRFEKELDTWKEKQLKGGNQKADTLDSSTAGSKQPKQVRPNEDNLQDLMREALKG